MALSCQPARSPDAREIEGADRAARRIEHEPGAHVVVARLLSKGESGGALPPWHARPDPVAAGIVPLAVTKPRITVRERSPRQYVDGARVDGEQARAADGVTDEIRRDERAALRRMPAEAELP